MNKLIQSYYWCQWTIFSFHYSNSYKIWCFKWMVSLNALFDSCKDFKSLYNRKILRDTDSQSVRRLYCIDLFFHLYVGTFTFCSYYFLGCPEVIHDNAATGCVAVTQTSIVDWESDVNQWALVHFKINLSSGHLLKPTMLEPSASSHCHLTIIIRKRENTR